MRIIVLFNLSEDVDIEVYEKWAREADIPNVNALGSVSKFTVHRAKGLFGSSAPSPYQYVELIDIDSLDGFEEDVSTEVFQALAAPFADFAEQPLFIVTESL